VRLGVWIVVTLVASTALLPELRGQLPQSPPSSPENPEAAVEPTPIPGTEVLLTPQPPSTESPLPGHVLKLGPPGHIEPILPLPNLETLARSGRLWSFHGRVKEFRFVGNHVFSKQAL